MGKLYKENWYKKWQKKKQFLANSQGCTGTGTGLYRYRYRAAHQRPTCTGTGPTCTGTGQKNATCTGIGPWCTGTGVPKLPRFCSFYVFEPKFIHR